MHWIAYQSNESGRVEVYIQPFPGPGGRKQISTGGGTSPKWGREGKELFYLDPDNRLMVVSLALNGPKVEPGTSEALFSLSPAATLYRLTRWPAVPHQRNHERSLSDHHPPQLEAALV